MRKIWFQVAARFVQPNLDITTPGEHPTPRVRIPTGRAASAPDQGFAIQDRTGGIFVSVEEDLGFAPRQQVRVTGELADDGFGLLILINVTDVKAHGRGPSVRPLPSTGIDVSGLSQGQTIEVTGFSGQFDDPEVNPRFQSDIKILD